MADDALDFDGDLTREVMQRLMQQQESEFDSDVRRPSRVPSTLSPAKAMLLGSVADGATTYRFLKKGLAAEANPLYRRFNNAPLSTGLAVAGTGIAKTALAHALKKKFPSTTRFVDAFLAQSAGARINAASEGVSPQSRYTPISGIADYRSRVVEAIKREPKRVPK